MGKKPRLRAPNFTQSDNLLLCDLVTKYKHIIENKKTDGASLLLKQKAWLEIANEYNSSTTGFSRTAESLQQTYKNLKKRAKKHASDEKMDIPVDPTLVLSIEKCGASSQNSDWEEVSFNTSTSEETCEEMLATLTKEENISDCILKRSTISTGGEAPPNVDKDPVMEKVRALAGPVVDDVDTTYDGDSSLMVSQNIPSIEHHTGSDSTIKQETQGDVESQDNNTYCTNNRVNLKKKTHHLLTQTEAKQAVVYKFKSLATEKLELLELQKELVKKQLQEEHERAEYNRVLRAMEMEDAKKRFIHNEKLREMEVEEMKRKNEYNEKMWQFKL